MVGLIASASWQKVGVLIVVWLGFVWVVKPIIQKWLLAVSAKA